MIAAKFDEPDPKIPYYKTMVKMLNDKYTKPMFIQREKCILTALNWDIPTPQSTVYSLV